MGTTRPADILRQLDRPGPPDGELLRRFLGGDSAAFGELLRRHAGLVLGVCRRVTGSGPDAEDAFQATFLILAQKAAALTDPGRLANWLYGVAYRVARRARRAAARRARREVTVSSLPEPPARPDGATPDPELASILDEELQSLAGHYREAVLMCDLQGVPRAEAAVALGVPEGTLSSRLANGRKKLAARLAKRGVALSAAAVPQALSEAQAGTVVTNDLLAKTGALVADCAAGAAVPQALAHLLVGGFTVRKTLMLGFAFVALAAGAVYAGRPTDQPLPADPLPAPKSVDPQNPKAERPQPKAAPDAGPEVTFTTAPKLRHALDLSFKTGSVDLVWAAQGRHIALVGQNPSTDDNGAPPKAGLMARSTLARFVEVPGEAGLAREYFFRAFDGDFVGFGSEGKTFGTAIREFDLISGRHHVITYTIADRPAGTPRVEGQPDQVASRRDFSELDGTVTHGYAFDQDLKTYRTVVYHIDTSGKTKKLEVVEMSVTTGKQTKSLLKTDFGQHRLSLDGKRFAVADADFGKVTVYAVDGGKKLCEHTFVDDPARARVPRASGDQAYCMFSPDGRRLAVARGVNRTTVIDTDTGKALPELEGLERVWARPDFGGFSGDGRLLVAICENFEVTTTVRPGGGGKELQQENWRRVGYTLTVWDTQTGKALKSWPVKAATVRVAFCPTRPLLAIAEQSGPQAVRVGFWDFRAELAGK